MTKPAPIMAGLALLLSVPALADPGQTVSAVRSVRVSVADLDLASSDGQRQLDLRLWRAARDLCTMTSLRDLSEFRLADRCRADALARARAQLPVLAD